MRPRWFHLLTSSLILTGLSGSLLFEIMMSNIISAYCNLCGASDSALYLEKGGFQLLKCSTCSVVYLKLAPDISGLTDFYSANYCQSGADNRGYESYQDCEVHLTMSFKRRQIAAYWIVALSMICFSFVRRGFSCADSCNGSDIQIQM